MNKFYIENKENLKILIVNAARKKNISLESYCILVEEG